MIVARGFFSVSVRGAKSAKSLLQHAPNMELAAVSFIKSRAYHISKVTSHLSLITEGSKVRLEQDKRTMRVVQSKSKPLVVLIPWLMAKPAPVMKYASFYLDQGFDVLNVQVSPWQMFQPVTGSQVVAGEVIEFLANNYKYDPLMVHGFSVGGYIWGEICVKALENLELYQPVMDRFVGQIWDSATDITETPIGVSRAVFPNNFVLREALHKYIRYHMRAFHNVATKHYIRSSQMFHTNLVRAPALFLVSKADPVGSEESNRRVHDSWASRGMQTYWKCWDKSPHVGHYRKYPKEYAAELFAFFDMLSLVQNPDKIRAKM